MEKYKAVYKCRLCGRVYQNGTTTGEKMAWACMMEINVGITGTVALAPTMTETHCCGGQYAGSFGLADFQGWECEAET